MTLNNFTFALVIFLGGCCSTEIRAKNICENYDVESVKKVSLLRLIANPERYAGHCVVTSGYMSFGERPSIYLSLEDYKNYNSGSAAGLVLPQVFDAQYDERYYHDHFGFIVVMVEDFVSEKTDLTMLHLYKTQFQLAGAPLKGDLIKR